MAAPKSRSDVVPDQLQPLVTQLVDLSHADFDLVLRAAAAERLRSKPRTMSWETLERAKGIVSLGGNAVEDCKALYDGRIDCELPTMPWEEFEKSKGVVSLGGNADDDCKALYDGDDVK